MGDILLEIFAQYIFKYPGCIVRWLVSGMKQPLKKYLEEDKLIDVILSMIVVSGNLAFIIYMKNYR